MQTNVFEINEEGETIIEVQAADFAGNITTASANVQIDLTNPEITSFEQIEDEDSITITIAADDTVSGIAQDDWRINIYKEGVSGVYHQEFAQTVTITEEGNYII